MSDGSYSIAVPHTPTSERLCAGRSAGIGKESQFALGVVAVFLLVTIPVMLHHEMWRDELQAWLLARDTVSLRHLFHELRYEGHPALWYLVLRAVMIFGRDPRWMQWLSVGISATSVYIFARLAPFPRVIRGLFAFGYFVAYGYTVVARSYGLEMLLFLILCALIASGRSPMALGLLLILIANTTVYGGIMVIALVVAFVVEAVCEGRRSRCLRQRLRRVSVVALCGALGVGLLVIQVRRPADAPFNGNGLAAGTLLRRASVRVIKRPFIERLTPVWRAYVPVPSTDNPNGLWDGDILIDRSPRDVPVAVFLSAVMLAIAALILRRSVLALVFFLLATCGLLIFSLLIYAGALYHHGHLFLALIVALWLAAPRRGIAARAPQHHGWRGRALAWLDEHAQLLVGALLVIQVVGATFRLVGDYLFPFSQGEAVAGYIRAHGLRDSVIAMYPALKTPTISGYLGRPVYEIDQRVSATYVPLSLGIPKLDDAAILAGLKTCCLVHTTDALLVVDHVLHASDPSLATVQLVRFTRAMVNENFYVYHVRSLSRAVVTR